MVSPGHRRAAAPAPGRAALALLCAVLALAPSAAAQEAGAEGEEPVSPYARPGPYVGVGGHFALENFDLPSGFDARDSGGVNARVGYRTHPNLAGEIVYDWVSPFDLDAAGSGIGDVEMNFVSMNARWFPFTGFAQPFLSTGVGLLVVRRDFVGFEDTAWVSAGRFGGGLDVYLHRNLVLSAEAVYVPPFEDPVQEFDFVLFGANLQVRF